MMTKTISQRELRNDSGEVMRRVAAGESFVVTRRGIPVADLLPHRADAARGRRFVPGEEFQAALADLPPWNVATFNEELEQLDDVVDDAVRDPWTRP